MSLPNLETSLSLIMFLHIFPSLSSPLATFGNFKNFMHSLNHNDAAHLLPQKDEVKPYKQTGSTTSQLSIHFQSFLNEWEFIY